jgi:signal transduction histidine kinase
LNKIISSLFSHEIKNSLASIKFGLEMFLKYDMDREEIKESSLELLNTLKHSH